MWIVEKETKKALVYKFCERYKDYQGKDKIVSVTMNSNTPMTRKKATALLHDKITLAKEKDSKQKDSRELFHTVANEWLEFTKPTVKASTHYNHLSAVKAIFKYISPKKRIKDITSVDIENMINDIYYTKNYSLNYAKMILITTKAVFKYAKKKKLLSNIAEVEEVDIKRKPRTTAEVQKERNKFLSQKELKSVLIQLKAIHPRIALLAEFQALTGLRIGELVALRYCDFDAERKKINVNGSIVSVLPQTDKNKRGTPKNIYSVRDVSLDNRAIDILNVFIVENKKLYLWYKGYEEQGYIFTTERGTPYNASYVSRVLRKVHIDGKELCSHMLRHTHISLLTELGIPLRAIMERVGHNDPRTTLGIYSHVTASMNEEIVNKLNQLSV